MKIRMELLMVLYVYAVFDKDCIGLSARKSSAYF